jgi:4-amino-4-deoxy-L-arabinose transferase-like glycosyltransferase
LFNLATLKSLANLFFRPKIFVLLVSACFIASSLVAIHRNVESPAGHKDLLEGDTGHYLDIARDFARGDFSMAYVQARPHRQPLYPLLLSPVFRWFGGSLAMLAAVNVALLTATFLLIYAGLLRRFHSRLVASIVGVLFLLNPFVHAHATRHLLTEPLHLLLAVGVLFAALSYLDTRRGSTLAIAAALAGLDYLTRPNGLFVFASMMTALLLNEAWRLFRRPSDFRAGAWRALKTYGLATLVFVAVSAPSWVPRYAYFGNPIHHGYLSNYLWTDTYKEGHVGQRFATYTAADYFSTHDARDVALRWLHGIEECGFGIPIRTEEKIPLLYFLALAGFVMTLWKGSSSYRTLALFGILQMIPLVWTNLSNPTIRVPYAAGLPFEVIFAALFLSQLPRIFCAGFMRLNGWELEEKFVFGGSGADQGDRAAVRMGDFAAKA